VNAVLWDARWMFVARVYGHVVFMVGLTLATAIALVLIVRTSTGTDNLTPKLLQMMLRVTAKDLVLASVITLAVCAAAVAIAYWAPVSVQPYLLI